MSYRLTLDLDDVYGERLLALARARNKTPEACVLDFITACQPEGSGWKPPSEETKKKPPLPKPAEAERPVGGVNVERPAVLLGGYPLPADVLEAKARCYDWRPGDVHTKKEVLEHEADLSVLKAYVVSNPGTPKAKQRRQGAP
jgi:hypothetical protein